MVRVVDRGHRERRRSPPRGDPHPQRARRVPARQEKSSPTLGVYHPQPRLHVHRRGLVHVHREPHRLPLRGRPHPITRRRRLARAVARGRPHTLPAARRRRGNRSHDHTLVHRHPVVAAARRRIGHQRRPLRVSVHPHHLRHIPVRLVERQTRHRHRRHPRAYLGLRQRDGHRAERLNSQRHPRRHRPTRHSTQHAMIQHDPRPRNTIIIHERERHLVVIGVRGAAAVHSGERVRPVGPRFKHLRPERLVVAVVVAVARRRQSHRSGLHSVRVVAGEPDPELVLAQILPGHAGPRHRHREHRIRITRQSDTNRPGVGNPLQRHMQILPRQQPPAQRHLKRRRVRRVLLSQHHCQTTAPPTPPSHHRR